jgi:hypothetical protein
MARLTTYPDIMSKDRQIQIVDRAERDNLCEQRRAEVSLYDADCVTRILGISAIEAEQELQDLCSSADVSEDRNARIAEILDAMRRCPIIQRIDNPVIRL